MKLQDLESSSVQKSQKVFESYFEKKIDLGALDQIQALQMLKKVRSTIHEYRTSKSVHRSETNPKYLQAVFMEQALQSHIDEGLADTMMRDPKTKAIMQKAQKGQNLSPDEQKVMTALAMAPKESKKKKTSNQVMESEVQQAQVVLAAQDMVDRMQGMLEDVTEMKFKDLPALVDSIRNEVGMSQAQQYMSDASAALDTLISCLQETKTSIEIFESD